MSVKKPLITLRTATISDLEGINSVIASALMSWQLAERVKRLSLASHQYTEFDFKHLQFVVAQTDNTLQIIGVAAWEDADALNTPQGKHALLLHGLYVDPAHHRQGIGQALFERAQQAAIAQHYDGLLVKAQADARGFFIAQGMQPLLQENDRQYGNRFWKPMPAGD
ncbi:MAG TPA: GNAT family N-acetyltransferase [Gammaproteobacteria bacterium]